MNKFGGIVCDKGIWFYIMYDNIVGFDYSIFIDGNVFC